MNSHRDFFALSAVCAAAFTFYLLIHLFTLLASSHSVFSGDHLPEHILISSTAPIDHHSPGTQNSNTLVKPVN